MLRKALNVIGWVAQFVIISFAVFTFTILLFAGIIPAWVPYVVAIVGFAAYFVKLWWNTLG